MTERVKVTIMLGAYIVVVFMLMFMALMVLEPKTNDPLPSEAECRHALCPIPQ